jgi:hypothetical protein
LLLYHGRDHHRCRLLLLLDFLHHPLDVGDLSKLRSVEGAQPMHSCCWRRARMLQGLRMVGTCAVSLTARFPRDRTMSLCAKRAVSVRTRAERWHRRGPR